MTSLPQNPESAEGGRPRSMSEPQRVLGVFTSPRRTLADIARRPTFLVPLIVAWIASMSVGYLFANKVFVDSAVEQIARTSVEQSLALEGADRQPSEAAVQERAATVRNLKRLWPVGTTVEILVVVMGVSLLFLLVMRLFGDRPDLRAMLSVTGWSWMAWTMIFAIPAWVRVGLSDPAALDPTDPYSLSVIQLGSLVPADAPPLLHTVAANLSLQNLWFLTLLAVGYAALSRKFSTARMTVVVFGVALVGFTLRGVVGF